MMVGRTKSRTNADNERFDIIRELGCLACNIEGWPGTPCQIHHELNGGQRFEDEHRYTVGLCPWHHQGDTGGLFRGCITGMTRAHGPSLAHNKGAFVARYGDRDARLLMQDALVRIVQSHRRRGEYLPEHEISEIARELWREVVKCRQVQ